MWETPRLSGRVGKDDFSTLLHICKLLFNLHLILVVANGRHMPLPYSDWKGEYLPPKIKWLFLLTFNQMQKFYVGTTLRMSCHCLQNLLLSWQLYFDSPIFQILNFPVCNENI